MMSQKTKIVSLLSRTFVRTFARPLFQPLFRLIFLASLKGMGIRNFDREGEITGELHFLRDLAAAVDGDALVIDAGANAGDYVDEVRQVIPTAEVHSFEPNPASFARLEQRFGSRPGIYLNNAGLSDKAGTATLFDEGDIQGSRVATLYADASRSNAVPREVRMMTLDEYVDSQKISHIDLLKIDVEGHELAVLRGARKSIESGCIDAVQFEFNRMNVYSHAFLNDFRVLLPGFSLLRLLPKGGVLLDGSQLVLEEIFDYQNIVAIRANHPLLKRSK